MNILEKKKEKFWLLKPFSCEIGENEIQEISAKLNIHPVVTKLLYARGYTTAKEMDTFLSMESERLCNPFDMAAKGFNQTKKTLVFGHWHCSTGWAQAEGRSEFGKNAKFNPFYGDGFIAIDSCVAHSKKVNVLVIEDNL